MLAASVVRWALVVVGVVLIAGTVAAETKLPQWQVRMCDFPRAQVAILCLFVAGGYVAASLPGGLSRWDVVLPLALLASAARQGAWIWPYVGAAKNDLQDARIADEHPSAIKIVISNLLQENEEYSLFREVIGRENADIIACAESTEIWIREIGKAFDETHPHRIAVPRDNYYGMAIWSRLPLSDVTTEYLVQDDVPSIHATIELESGEPIRLHCLHPRPPAPQEGDTSAPRDAELILMARRIEENRKTNRPPTVVVGDLNDVAWSRTTDLFLRISGLLDPRRGRGLFNSFHAGHWWFRVPLDHVFCSNDFRLKELRRLDYVGSDHFPMCITLALDPQAASEQESHTADADDHKEAEERLDTQVEREQSGDEDGHLSQSRKGAA